MAARSATLRFGMSIRSRMLAGDQPYERRLRVGVSALSDAELVALVAGIQAQGRDDVALGHELRDRRPASPGVT